MKIVKMFFNMSEVRWKVPEGSLEDPLLKVLLNDGKGLKGFA
jgi:hypothetical protein